MSKKLAILFPGLGYHTDKPLLYYSRKLVKELGYDIVEVSYHDLPTGIKGIPEKMYEAYEIARAQSVEQLKTIDFGQYESILCISKSIGTAVAASSDQILKLDAKHIYLTPVLQSMEVIRPNSGIVFHGLKDDWCPNEPLESRCNELGIEYITYEGGSHSIETGNTSTDLNYLTDVIQRIREYII